MDLKSYIELKGTDCIDGYESEIRDTLTDILMAKAKVAPESDIQELIDDFFSALLDWLEDDAKQCLEEIEDDDYLYRVRDEHLQHFRTAADEMKRGFRGV